MKKEITLEKLFETMLSGFAAVDARFNTIETSIEKMALPPLPMNIADIKRDMATKDQLIALHT
jgi:hypothetical protein